MLLLTGCSYPNSAWQNVNIAGIGTFKVPKTWIFTQNGDIIYFTDKPINESTYHVYLKGAITDIHIKAIVDTDVKQFYEYVKDSRGISSEVFSNSASYGFSEYFMNGISEKKYDINMSSSTKVLTFISLEALVDKDTIVKIAKSFLMELDD